jgi:hypothetical protein
MFLGRYCRDLVGSRELDLKLSQMLHTREVISEASLLYNIEVLQEVPKVPGANSPQEVCPTQFADCHFEASGLNYCYDGHAGHRCSKSALHHKEKMSSSLLFSVLFSVPS